MTKKQRGLLIAASAAAAVLAVLFFFHPGWLTKNTDGDQMIGTISRADRYRPGGMTAKDVVLTKADVTKLLQDPAFQNLIKNVEFQRLLGDPRFAAMMKEDQAGASRLLGDPRFTGLFQAAADPTRFPTTGRKKWSPGSNRWSRTRISSAFSRIPIFPGSSNRRPPPGCLKARRSTR